MALAPASKDYEIVPSRSNEYIATATMSFEEWLDWDHEGGLSEWVDGTVYFYMSATDEHDIPLTALRGFLAVYFEVTGAGFVRGGPYAMEARRGGPGPGREPDLMVILAEHADRKQSSHLVGAADVAVEVVSPDSVRRDNVVKFLEYEAAGIPEYWIIDSRPRHRSVGFFALTEGEYFEEELDEEGRFSSCVLPAFWLRPEWLWEDPPRPMAAAREDLGARFA